MAHKNSVQYSETNAHMIVVIGLPGSGKSTYMNSLKGDDPELTLFDDYQGKAFGDDSDPRLGKHFSELCSLLKAGKSVVVSDIRYCVPYELNTFLAAVLSVASAVHLDLRYFENNPAQCQQNVINRKQDVENQLDLIRKLSDHYNPHNIGKALSVYKGK